jgi:hypothetical protein
MMPCRWVRVFQWEGGVILVRGPVWGDLVGWVGKKKFNASLLHEAQGSGLHVCEIQG